MASTTRITQLDKNQTRASDSNRPVRIIGEKRRDSDITALRKIARACIALARQQLTQEQKADQSETTPTSKGGADA
jgi:hypothetical protein